MAPKARKAPVGLEVGSSVETEVVAVRLLVGEELVGSSSGTAKLKVPPTTGIDGGRPGNDSSLAGCARRPPSKTIWP